MELKLFRKVMTMKKVLISMVVAVMASVSAFAVENWVSVDIGASKGDTEPGSASLSCYTAYYCTAEAAQEMFGVSTYDAVANYLKTNYDKGWAALEEAAGKGDAMLLNQKLWGEEQYTFTAFYQNPLVSGDYLALVSYVGETANAAPEIDVLSGEYAGGGTMVFDDSDPSTPHSGWTQTVPEPTSGMLFLLGSALLALRRKNRE